MRKSKRYFRIPIEMFLGARFQTLRRQKTRRRIQ
tara:strand:- start:198 stop:299 length:102 start_codon:yes stop_codon:yes gene_type:complete